MFESLPLLEPVWWNWYLAGVVLMLLEIVVPGAIVIWFGLGALATGFITEHMGGLYWPLQFGIFFIISILAMLSGRTLFRRPMPSPNGPTLNQRLNRYMGKQARLRTPIQNGTGRIRMGNAYITVKGPDLPIGTIVEIVGVESSTLVVAKADTNI